MIRCVVFDFDGTLVRSNAIKRQAYFDAVADFADGGKLIEQVFADGILGNRYAVFAEVARYLHPNDLEKAKALGTTLAARYTELCRNRIACCEEVTGASAALGELAKRGKALYLVSATPEVDLHPCVERRRLAALFRQIRGGPVEKTTHLRAIARRENLASSALVVVGDGIDDRDAASDVGCHFLPVADDPEGALVSMHGALRDLSDLPNVISGLCLDSSPGRVAAHE